MPHPDSIKVVVEDGANVSVTSPAALGNVSVTPEVPAVISINTNSAQVTLAELISGTPQDGQVIVFDATTNTFLYDFSSGGAGNLISDLEVTNRSTAIGDAVAQSYEANDSQEGILRDILSPKSPVITDVKFNWRKASSGTSLPGNVLSSLEYAEIEFMFPERLGDGAWQVYLDGNFAGQTSQLPSDYGQSSKAIIYNLPLVVSGEYGQIKSFELRSTYDDNGISRDFSYEGNFSFGKHAWISHASNANEADPISELTGDIDFYSAPFSVQNGPQYVTLKGTSDTQDSDNFTWFAIPSEFTVHSISEIVGDSGVANRTFSFSRVGNLFTYPLPNNGSYSVYLYRSNQKGALSAESSLRIKLKTS